jgi:signal transduction histidine kinase
MSGGGGGGGRYSRRDITDLQPEQSAALERERVESEVNGLLADQLREINDRDTEKVGRYLDAIEDALRNEIDEVDRRLFGGSVAKHTYVDGISDIDSLVILREGGDRDPADVRNQFAKILRERLAADVADVSVGNLAVTVTYRDGTQVQLLPAVQQGDRLGISSADGRSWTQIHPRSFARTLTEVNQAQAGQVIPTVKLVKAIVAGLPQSERLAGYHAEALAVAAFRAYDGTRTPKAMVTHFFETAAQNVRTPIHDVTGQSRHLDEALGERDSAARQRLSGALERIARTMREATSATAWRELLE